MMWRHRARADARYDARYQATNQANRMRQGLHDQASLQQMLYDTLDRSDDIVVMLEQTDDADADIIVASANGAFCRTSGYSPAELIGRSLASLAAPDSDPSRCTEIVRAAHECRSFRSEMLCARQSGAPFWLGLHLMPVRDATPPCFVILGRDITESLQARQQQAAIQGLLAKVFLCVKAPVAIVSDSGLLQMTNPALDQLLGYPPGGLVGKRSIDCVASSARAATMAARERQAEDGHDYTIASRLLRADGSEVAVEITSITVQRDDLRRFRILTVLKQADEAPPSVTVHVAGKIKLVGLDEVKEALGARWADVSARAMASAEHVVRRRCGPRDTFSRTPDGGFLICFADATEDEAAFRATALAREIRTRLIGEGQTGATANVSAITAAVDVPNAPGRSADMLALVIGERLNGRLAQIEAEARETLRRAVYTTTCRLETVRSRRTREPVAQFARLPSDVEQRILAAYSALPVNDRQEFDFDRLVLGVAAEQAITEIAVGGSLLILVNVEFEVFLERRRAERYIAACQALDSRVRERLVLILSGMPRGFPKSRVLECVMRLRPFCQSVGFQSDSMDAPAVEFSLLGGAIVVLQEDIGAPQNAKDLEKLAKLIDSLHAYQARVLVRHVATWEDMKQLVRLGVDLVAMVEDEREAGGAPPRAG
jgi:PAS domain S-box-containing protein